jgi:hypothetical protein
MRVIGIIGGISAYREVQEEYIPERVPPMQDIVQLVRDTYQFIQFPVFLPGMQVPSVVNFAGGRFQDQNGAFAINQLLLTPKGDSVAATNTDQSDMVLDHLVNLFQTTFGYRLAEVVEHAPKIHWSHVVVEFDSGIEQFIGKIAAVEAVVTLHTGKAQPFRTKTISFGTSTSPLPPTADTIDILENNDFVIERRIDRPFEENRFFSMAPLRTTDHIQALVDIETALRGH